MTIFTRDGWRGWFESMQSPEWDRTDALVFADWCRDWGEVAVEEYVRVACIPDLDATECTEVSANWCPQCGDCCCPFPEDERSDPSCPLHSPYSPHASGNQGREVRLAQLLADNPSWSSLPCPGYLAGKSSTECQICGNLDDPDNILRGFPLTRWLYTPFVRGVGLRMEEIVRRFVPVPGDGDESLTPTPLARALVAGLPTLRQLRVTDREPYRSQFGYCWYDSRGNAAEFAAHHLPPPIWDCMSLPVLELTGSHYQHLKVAPTPDAAKDALADGVWQWVAGFKPKEGK